MKRKKKVFDKGKETRRRARGAGLAPAATKIVADKRKKREKHKIDLRIIDS